MQYDEESRTFERYDPERKRLDSLANYISLSILGNTQREILRRMARPGEPIGLIVTGLLVYAAEARYTQGKLDLEDPEQLRKGIELSREIKSIEFTIRLFERVLGDMPSTQKEKEKDK